MSTDNTIIKQALTSSKTVAMVGISSIKKEDSTSIIRRPSIIVMEYLQEFGYKVIPVNPNSKGKEIHGEVTVSKLEDINFNDKVLKKKNIIDNFRTYIIGIPKIPHEHF